MPKILKPGRKLADTYYKAICPECDLIGAFKETEAATKSYYANGAISYVYFHCPNCEHMLKVDVRDRISKEMIDSIIKEETQI